MLRSDICRRAATGGMRDNMEGKRVTSAFMSLSSSSSWFRTAGWEGLRMEGLGLPSTAAVSQHTPESGHCGTFLTRLSRAWEAQDYQSEKQGFQEKPLQGPLLTEKKLQTLNPKSPLWSLGPQNIVRPLYVSTEVNIPLWAMPCPARRLQAPRSERQRSGVSLKVHSEQTVSLPKFQCPCPKMVSLKIHC